MESKKILSKVFEGVLLGLGLFISTGLVYAITFSTWGSGQSPQASPANGNVKLSGQSTNSNSISTKTYSVVFDKQGAWCPDGGWNGNCPGGCPTGVTKDFANASDADFCAISYVLLDPLENQVSKGLDAHGYRVYKDSSNWKIWFTGHINGSCYDAVNVVRFEITCLKLI